MVISKKILLNIIFTLGLLLVLLSAILIFSSKLMIGTAFTDLSKEKLWLIRDLKQQTLENFFLDTQKQITTLSKQAYLQNIFQEFKVVFDGLLVVDEASLPFKRFNPNITEYYANFLKKQQQYVNNEQDEIRENLDLGMLLQGLNQRTINLQTKYLANIDDPLLSEYTSVHDKYHKYLQNIAVDYNYKDLLLLDLHGNIIYSVQKNIDFANSIFNTNLANSELVNIFNQVKYSLVNQNAAHTSNFAEYLPDYQEPVCFIAQKINNVGVLLVSIKLSHIENLMQLPTKDLKTTLYLLDKDSKLISTNNFGKKVYTAASKNLNFSIPGNIEGLGKDKLLDLIYFTPIKGTNLNLIVEFKKSMLLANLIKPLVNMFYITTVGLVIILALLYVLAGFAIVKNTKKFDKISEFIKDTIVKKDFSTRISLENDELPYNLVDLLNNMLGWFHNILEQVIIKIKKIVEKYNQLVNKITLVAQYFRKEQLSFAPAKEITNQLSINVFKVQHESQQYQSILNQHKKIFLDFDNFINIGNVETNKVKLNTSLEYIAYISHALDKLFKQAFFSRATNNKGKPKKYLLFLQQIKQLNLDLKPKIAHIKKSLDQQIIEHDLLGKIVKEFFDKLSLVNTNINALLDSQKSLLWCSNEQISNFSKLQKELLDLELKYNNFNQQLLEIVNNNVKLNAEIASDEEDFDMQALESNGS